MSAVNERRAAPLVLRWLDVVVLLVALPVFLAADAPLLGWAATGVAWLIQRGVQAALAARMEGTEDPQHFFRLAGVSLIGRPLLLVAGIVVAGVIDRPAGFAAALLALAVFTTYLLASIANRPPKPAGLEGKAS